jgi:hypothetical protein
MNILNTKGSVNEPFVFKKICISNITFQLIILKT